MTLRILMTATVASLPAFAAPAFAQAPSLVPTALVEDVNSKTAGVAFMDYVGPGQVIALGATDVLVLSYLRSCEHETITGGTVTVGLERSSVQGGRVLHAKVACDGGKMQLSRQETNTSAASAFRLQSAEGEPTLYARAPVVRLPRGLRADERTLLIVRTDRRGESLTLPFDEAVAAAGFYDLAKAGVSLARGATYEASIAGRKMTFRIDPKARPAGPVVSRLLRFQ